MKIIVVMLYGEWLWFLLIFWSNLSRAYFKNLEYAYYVYVKWVESVWFPLFLCRFIVMKLLIELSHHMSFECSA